MEAYFNEQEAQQPVSIQDMVHVVGTNHIAKESLEKVKQEFLEFKPEIIGVELDKDRLIALLNPNQEKQRVNFALARKLGLGTFLFMLLARWVQQTLGKKTGLKPGSDMLYAVQLAKNNNVLLALIDRSLHVTMKKMFKELTFKEKLRFFSDLFFGVFKKSQRQMAMKVKKNLDLNAVPSLDTIDYLLSIVKKRYPTVHKVLVQERNEYMAHQLQLLHKKHPTKRILAVVGAGHEEEIKRLAFK